MGLVRLNKGSTIGNEVREAEFSDADRSEGEQRGIGTDQDHNQNCVISWRPSEKSVARRRE